MSQGRIVIELGDRCRLEVRYSEDGLAERHVVYAWDRHRRMDRVSFIETREIPELLEVG